MSYWNEMSEEEQLEYLIAKRKLEELQAKHAIKGHRFKDESTESYINNRTLIIQRCKCTTTRLIWVDTRKPLTEEESKQGYCFLVYAYLQELDKLMCSSLSYSKSWASTA
jgi:hypothetical protein